MKIAYVFDMDNTLITFDEDKRSATGYTQLCVEGHLPLYYLFHELREKYCRVYILTSSDPVTKAAICLYFNLNDEEVFCRNYWLISELGVDGIRNIHKKLKSDKYFLDEYYRKISEYKRSILQKLSEKHDIVMYWDDIIGTKHFHSYYMNMERIYYNQIPKGIDS